MTTALKERLRTVRVRGPHPKAVRQQMHHPIMPNGFPARAKTLYNADLHPQLVLEAMSAGAAPAELPLYLNVSTAALRRWCEEHTEFREAVELGCELSAAWWLSQGRVNLQNKTFNAALYAQNMQNRFGWCSARVKDGKALVNDGQALLPEGNSTEGTAAGSGTTAVTPLTAKQRSRVLEILQEIGAVPIGTQAPSTTPIDADCVPVS